MALLKRLNTEEELTRYQGQFVPIKLDISTPEYKSFRANHPTVGKTIPKIFVIRADGETMFAKATSLRGDSLFELLEASARHGGRILNEREIALLEKVRQKMVDLTEKGDIPGAVSQLKQIRKLGTPGEFASYAEPAIKLEQLVVELTTKGRESLKPINELLEQDDQTDEAELVAGLNNYLAMTDRYRGLKTLRDEFSHINKTISRDKNLRALFSGVKTIEKSQTARTENAIKRSVEKLDAIVAQRKTGPLSEQAKRLSEQLKKKLGE